jgi:hypothetical protein
MALFGARAALAAAPENAWTRRAGIAPRRRG